MRGFVVAIGLWFVACGGSSSKTDDRSGGGGSGTGGSSRGGTSPTGGSNSGGANPAGGVAGNGGTNPNGGSDPSGGSGGNGGAMPSGGTIGEGGAEAGAGNVGGEGAAAGSAGIAGGGATAGGGASGGGSGACTTPNPAGCPEVPCASDETCWMRQGDCRPGSCTCSETGEWVCTRDCGGGVCRPSSCPANCEPSEGTCTAGGDGGVTWVCYPNGGAPFGGQALVDAGCQDLATQIPRFCCPATFKPECRVAD